MKKLNLSFVLSALLVGFIGCGGGGGSSGGDGASGQNTANTPVTVETVSRSITNETPTSILENSAGVKVVIPQGAVPKAVDGTNQPLVFSLEKDAVGGNVTLPAGYTAIGDTWLLGPQNFVFSKPVEIGIPLGSASADSYTIFHYNPEKSRWEPMPLARNSESLIANARTSRMLSLSDQYNWTVTRGGGHYIMAGSSRETLASNPKKFGVLTIKNDYTTVRRYADYCILKDSSILTYADQHLESFQLTPGYLGDGDDIASFADNELPQGRYTIQIGRTKGDTATGRDHRADCDGWFETTFDIAGKGEIYYENGDPQVISDAVIHVNDYGFDFNDFRGGTGCTPCSSEYPPPSTLYGVGNIGVTLNWFKRVADLDVALIYPNGEETIFYDHTVSNDGKFVLDVDRRCDNINVGDLTENIYSKAGETVDSGTYTVKVTLYDYCGEEQPPVKYSLRLIENGHIQTYSGTLTGKGDFQSYDMILRHE